MGETTAGDASARETAVGEDLSQSDGCSPQCLRGGLHYSVRQSILVGLGKIHVVARRSLKAQSNKGELSNTSVLKDSVCLSWACVLRGCLTVH